MEFDVRKISLHIKVTKEEYMSQIEDGVLSQRIVEYYIELKIFYTFIKKKH